MEKNKYVVTVNGTMTIEEAITPEEAKNMAISHYVYCTEVRLATAEDIAWLNAMSGN